MTRCTLLSAAALWAAQSTPALAQPMPVHNEQAWLRAHTHPLAGITPQDSNDDLRPFDQIVGDAMIVGLGEGTHGTHEFFACKRRLFEYLVNEKGFTLFAIEANQPEAARVNAYIQGEGGDAASLIAGMGFWIWNTHEMLDLVEWMREHNAQVRAGGPGRMLTFAGVDMQTPGLAMAEVKAFLAEFAGDDGADLRALAATYDQPRPAAPTTSDAGSASRVSGALLAGRRVQVAASIRTRGTGEARLWLRAIDASGKPLALGTVNGPGMRSTGEFTGYGIAIDIPAEAALVLFGSQFTGAGEAWFDSFEVLADNQPLDLPGIDLTFDGDTLSGVFPALENCDLAIDREVFHQGRGSLRVRAPAAAQGPSRQEWTRASRDIVRAIEARREHFIARAGEPRTEWAIQCARLVHQWTRLTPLSTSHRDACMADNTLWVLERHPGERMVLWAHNFHVSAIPGKQGGDLERALGAAYVPIGFSTSKGTYAAIGEGPLLRTGNVLQTPAQGSFEAMVDELGHDAALIDLRPAVLGEPGGASLTQPLLFGGIVGAVAMPQRFLPLPLSPSFDAIIHIRRTTASHLLTDAPE